MGIDHGVGQTRPPFDNAHRENGQPSIVGRFAKTIGEVALSLSPQTGHTVCRHPFENPFADVEALQVLETVEQTAGGGGVAPRLELPQPDETRRAVGHCLRQQPAQSRSGRGVEAARDSLLDPSLGGDQRGSAQPLDRCRRRQHGQCSPAFTDEPPRQVLVRARPLGLPIEPDFEAPRGLSGVVAVPVD